MVETGAAATGHVKGPLLQATPNPVPRTEGFGKTLITWSTGDGSHGEVYVSSRGEPEQRFADGVEGSNEATWIGSGNYKFTLYTGTDHRVALATIVVRQSAVAAAPRFGHLDSKLRPGRAVAAPAPQGVIRKPLAADKPVDPAERDRIESERLKCLMAFTLGERDSCIEVGAHEGRLLREIVRCAPQAPHIAYEPIPKLHAQLAKEFPQVEVRCAVLSNTAGVGTFNYVTSNPGYSGLKERSYPGSEQIETIEVRRERLDDALPQGFVPALIVIDVEGAEREVVEGGIRTISQHKPIVLFEHGRGAADHYGTRPEHMFALLCNEAGLRIFDLDGNGPYDRQRFIDTFEAGSRWNFLAHR